MNYPDEAAAFSAAFLRWKTFTCTPAHYEKNVAKTLVLADISTTKRASITMKRKGGCSMKCIQQDDALIFAFCGDLDNLSILKIKADVIREIDRVQAPVVKFDFKDVTFIDSTGIGFLLARYNQVQSYRGELILKNISPAIRRLFALSGIFQIMRVEKENDRKEVHV
jgi:stage II sporulation protein AA (anti-sigma F factor antagonist)